MAVRLRSLVLLRLEDTVPIFIMSLPLNNIMEKKICCIDGCENECDKGRRYCHRHFLDRKAEQRAARKAAGLKVKTTYKVQCTVCGKTYEAFRKSAKFCSDCFKNIMNKDLESDNNYGEHRLIAENIIGRKLTYNEVIHHLDGNSQNNSLDNLILLSRSKHTSLHRHINIEGAILEAKFGADFYDKWISSIKVLSLAWLNSNNIEYKTLKEIEEERQ